MINLKPCPFCGSKASIVENITGTYHVSCNDRKCKCLMVAGMPVWRNTPEEAADIWNRRADNWISVSDRLPPNYKPVLALNSRGEYGIAWYYCWWHSREEDYQFDVSKITHWMPLPEPPKEGRVDG